MFLRAAQDVHSINKADLAAREQKLEDLIASKEKAFQFDMSWVDDLHEKTLMECSVTQITPLVTTRGRILVTTGCFYLQSMTNVSAEPMIKVKLSNIRRALPRRYLLRHTGVELFINGRKSLFLAFRSAEQVNEFIQLLVTHAGCGGRADLAAATEAWREGQLTNFDYLMALNEHAGRSFMDLTQYPVFPWVLQDYTSHTLDLSNPGVYRDLSRPIGALNPKRLSELRQRYLQMPADPDNPRFLYGTHYSTPGYILYYLVRKSPELMLKLHNGKFDLADRMFASITDTWNGVLNNPSDVKEV